MPPPHRLQGGLGSTWGRDGGSRLAVSGTWGVTVPAPGTWLVTVAPVMPALRWAPLHRGGEHRGLGRTARSADVGAGCGTAVQVPTGSSNLPDTESCCGCAPGPRELPPRLSEPPAPTPTPAGTSRTSADPGGVGFGTRCAETVPARPTRTGGRGGSQHLRPRPMETPTLGLRRPLRTSRHRQGWAPVRPAAARGHTPQPLGARLTSRSRPAATVTMSPVSLLMVNMFWAGLGGLWATTR